MFCVSAIKLAAPENLSVDRWFPCPMWGLHQMEVQEAYFQSMLSCDDGWHNVSWDISL